MWFILFNCITDGAQQHLVCCYCHFRHAPGNQRREHKVMVSSSAVLLVWCDSFFCDYAISLEWCVKIYCFANQADLKYLKQNYPIRKRGGGKWQETFFLNAFIKEIVFGCMCAEESMKTCELEFESSCT